MQFKDTTLYCEEYQDIYYNPTDGLAESTLVFLEGSRLKETIHQHKEVNLVEAGFGTGLNFLLTACLLSKLGYSKPFTYSAIEGFPLSREVLTRVYNQPTFDSLNAFARALLVLYPKVPKTGEVLTLRLSSNLTLRLLLYPLEKALNHLPGKVDYWYLDGFNPKKNPEMWSDPLWFAMRNRSPVGSHAATFTASRQVKDGLTAAGFSWKRLNGFGAKRHRLTGVKA